MNSSVMFSLWRTVNLFLMIVNHHLLTSQLLHPWCLISLAPQPRRLHWPLFCLKEYAQELSIPLCRGILFNESLESSVLSDCWGKALVTPVFKKGDRSRVINFCPISLTSPICKIMESITKDRIEDHLLANYIIPPRFTAVRCCSTRLF